jgi:hypothetical protein
MADLVTPFAFHFYSLPVATAERAFLCAIVYCQFTAKWADNGGHSEHSTRVFHAE